MEQLNYPEQYSKLITSFLESPELAYRVDEGLLAQLIEKYPFSQPLYLISASKEKDDQNKLSLASAYAPQREVLYAIVKHPEEFKYKAGPKHLDETAANAVEADLQTGNAIEPPSYLEQTADVSYYPDEEDNRNAGLPEDAASGDPVFEHIIESADSQSWGALTDESNSNEDTGQASDEEDLVEEIAEAARPYETIELGIVSSEHNAFIEADEGRVQAEETFEEIDEAPQPGPGAETIHERKEESSQPELETDLIETPEESYVEPILRETADSKEALEQNNLIGSIAGADFFAFEKSAVDPLQAEEPKRAAVRRPAEGRNLSKYNDDKLPYTFLWWLNKTRKEHAETYQPYAGFSLDTSQAISRTVPVEELNHQIIENIFHLQTPLDDIAKEAPANTVHFELKRKEDVIIEKFIKEEPQIKPPQPEKIDNENKARRSAEDPNDLVSETLARIYTDQMLYQKAIDTYKKLSLKFPEKSTYFADQIVELEKKIN